MSSEKTGQASVTSIAAMMLEESRSGTRTGCSHVPTRFEAIFLDTLDLTVGPAFKKAHAAVSRLVAEELAGVILSGPVGCGKSALAAAACNEPAVALWETLFAADSGLSDAQEEGPDQDRRAVTIVPGLKADVRRAERRMERACPRWLSIPTTLSALRRQMRQEERPAEDEVAEATDTMGLLVLDDLGLEKASDWTIEILSGIVSARYDAGHRTIVTTNLSIAELERAGYERVTSRLAEDGVLLELRSAKDYRLKLRKSAS